MAKSNYVFCSANYFLTLQNAEPTIACCWFRYELCIQSSIINTWPSSSPTYPHSYPPMCNMDIDGWMNVHKCMSLNKPQCVVCYVNWFVKSVTNNIGTQQPMNQWNSQSTNHNFYTLLLHCYEFECQCEYSYLY